MGNGKPGSCDRASIPWKEIPDTSLHFPHNQIVYHLFTEQANHKASSTEVLAEAEQLDETFHSRPKISTRLREKRSPATQNVFDDPVPDLAGVVLNSRTLRLRFLFLTVLWASASFVDRQGYGSRRDPNKS